MTETTKQTPVKAEETAPEGTAVQNVSEKARDAGVDTGKGPTPQSLQELALDLPENDEVQKAYKNAMLADTGKEEAQAKIKAIKASPDASETPSGAALVKVAGESDDVRRGEKYLREKTARRWGYVPVDA